MKAKTARKRPASMDPHTIRRRAAVGGGLVALIVMLVLAVQNTRPVGVHFAVWAWNGAPLFAVIVVSLLVGFGLGLLFMVVERRDATRPRTRSRRLTLRGRRAPAAPAASEAPPTPTATIPPQLPR